MIAQGTEGNLNSAALGKMKRHQPPYPVHLLDRRGGLAVQLAPRSLQLQLIEQASKTKWLASLPRTLRNQVSEGAWAASYLLRAESLAQAGERFQII